MKEQTYPKKRPIQRGDLSKEEIPPLYQAKRKPNPFVRPKSNLGGLGFLYEEKLGFNKKKMGTKKAGFPA